jgi:cytochrome c oxidase subunit 4
MAEHHSAHAAEGHGEVHVTLPFYYRTFAWLMGLLIITLVAAWLNLGLLNLPIAMAIAIWKAGLIFTNFMHLKFSTALARVFALCAFFFLLIMFVLTLSDYFSRGWLGPRVW